METIFGRYARTSDCGALRRNDADSQAVLMGWVHRIRDLGRAGKFVLLRDRGGITQLLFQPDLAAEAYDLAKTLGPEHCIAVRGEVRARDDKNVNPDMATGEVEVRVTDLEVLSRSEVPPFEISGHLEAKEELRLRHRYLDMRRPEFQRNFLMRAAVTQAVRRHMSQQGFVEIETPFLVKYTPGGARNFLVPARLKPGRFYALAESPQIFKQLLMIAGFDRYFQVVKCFRDEDPRQDRQVEFTQIDVEMSFATEEMILSQVEGMARVIWKDAIGLDLPEAFPRMTYAEAMSKYGTDKPDLRFGLEHQDITELGRDCGFRVFEQVAADGGLIKAIRVPGAAKVLSRKKLDDLTRFVQREEVGPVAGLAWTKLQADGTWQGAFPKAAKPEALDAVAKQCSMEEGDALLVLAGPAVNVHKAADALRRRLGADFGLIDETAWALCWVTDFPLFEWSEEAQTWASSHHPFTMPVAEDLDLLETDQGKVRARAYDLVCNGYEIAGGSIRIHDREIQARVLRALGISDQEAKDKFGFLLEAFKYGAPPHGGIAAGLDRIMMLLTGTDSIRDVIPFPKTINGLDLMTGAPGGVFDAQLAELHVQVTGVSGGTSQDADS